MILVDTNVLLDVVENDREWADWSQNQLDALSLQDRLCINPVIYAELSIAFERIEELDQVLDEGALELLEIPREALFLAAKAFVRYRRRLGSKRNVLPDFFVGAHAAVAGMPIVTRDVRRYRFYFPRVEVIHPG